MNPKQIDVAPVASVTDPPPAKIVTPGDTTTNNLEGNGDTQENKDDGEKLNDEDEYEEYEDDNGDQDD